MKNSVARTVVLGGVYIDSTKLGEHWEDSFTQGNSRLTCWKAFHNP